MTCELLYLRPNVQVEPLFDSWYAWSHLIPPATAARNITERHLKIMDSYIGAPHVHEEAVRNPKMLGGPFIDYSAKRVPDISKLRDRTIKERADLIELSKGISNLDHMLRTNAKGFSLQHLYSQVSQVLRGYVELVYDLNNHPSFRLIESLLYCSKYYQRAAQSMVLSIINQDHRPFILSTPRLESSDSLHLPIAFDDERVDWLFRLKQHPQPWNKIRCRFELNSTEEALLRSLFTEEAPPRYEPYRGSGVRWRYFGHACILAETGQVSMLFDPVLSYTYENDISRYTYQDLPDEIDFVLITHNHQDHILFETLLQIREKVKTFIVPRNGRGALQDPSLKLLLKTIGCKNVIEVGDMESIDFDGGCITGIPFMGEHGDLDVASKAGYSIRLGKKSLLFLADSCNIEPNLYKHVHRTTGDIDVVFVGMECDGAPLSWIYGPLLTCALDRKMDSSRRLAGSNCEQAADIINCFNCRDAFVYAMGQEPWLNYVMSIKYTESSRPILESDRLIRECRARGINAERLFGEKEILLEDC